MSAANNTPENEGPVTIQRSVMVTAAVALAYLFTSYRIGENAQTLGVCSLLALLALRPRCGWLPWLGVLAALGVTLAQRPLDVPNHHVMLTYLSTMMVLVLSGPRDTHAERLRRNVRWMLVVLMAFATGQKVASSTFCDGSYLGYEVARAGFARPVLALIGGPYETGLENDRRIVEFRNTRPDEAPTAELEPMSPWPVTIAYAFAISILAIEAWLCVAMLFAPGALVTHLSLMAFAVSLIVLRQELTFISVVSAMGLLSCPMERTWLRSGYAGLALLAAAGALKTLG